MAILTEEQLLKNDPAKHAKKYYRRRKNTLIGYAFYRVIYERWAKKHEPYWKLKDCRDYTFNATLAAYQLGVSMILEKCGY